jgi:nicotinate phosphoribosyltransferase
VAKQSHDKVTVGGCKRATRRLDGAGRAIAEEVVVEPCRAGPWAPAGGGGRPLQVPLVEGGRIVHRRSLDEARAHHRAALAELDPAALDLSPGPPALAVHVAVAG